MPPLLSAAGAGAGSLATATVALSETVARAIIVPRPMTDPVSAGSFCVSVGGEGEQRRLFLCIRRQGGGGEG